MRGPLLWGLMLSWLVSGTSAASPLAGASIHALAPVEVAADRLRTPASVGVDADGAVYVSHGAAGTVTRFGREAHPEVLLTGLRRPAGLVLDDAGRLLVAEEGGGRLRRDPDGTTTVLASGLPGPRWLALGADGILYVAVRRPGPADDARSDAADSDEDGDDEDGPQAPSRILAVRPDGTRALWAENLSPNCKMHHSELARLPCPWACVTGGDVVWPASER